MMIGRACGAVPAALVLFCIKPRAMPDFRHLTGSRAFLHAYERLGVIEERSQNAWRCASPSPSVPVNVEYP